MFAPGRHPSAVQLGKLRSQDTAGKLRKDVANFELALEREELQDLDQVDAATYEYGRQLFEANAVRYGC